MMIELITSCKKKLCFCDPLVSCECALPIVLRPPAIIDNESNFSRQGLMLWDFFINHEVRSALFPAYMAEYHFGVFSDTFPGPEMRVYTSRVPRYNVTRATFSKLILLVWMGIKPGPPEEQCADSAIHYYYDATLFSSPQHSTQFRQ